MKPLINSPGHVKALEFLQELHKTGPAAQVGWSLGEAWDYFLRGKAVFVFSLGRRRRALPGRGRSKVKGKCAAAVIPSSNEYYDFEKKEFVKLDTPRVDRQHHRRLVARRRSRTSRPIRKRPIRSCR